MKQGSETIRLYSFHHFQNHYIHVKCWFIKKMTHQSNLVIFNSALISIISSQFCLVHTTLEQKLRDMSIPIFCNTHLLHENKIHQGTFLS